MCADTHAETLTPAAIFQHCVWRVHFAYSATNTFVVAGSQSWDLDGLGSLK